MNTDSGTTRMMIAGIPVEVRRKKIKNLHLYVKPPDGQVLITAPRRMSDRQIAAFAEAHTDWILSHIRKIRSRPPKTEPCYVSGETIFIWGKAYTLRFVPAGRNAFFPEGDTAVLCMRENSTAKQRESFLREEYRRMLTEETERLLPKWERITGLHCDSWQTKDMVSRWGTCNIAKRKIWLNVRLARKPVECLEYVILHELIHLRCRNHDAAFYANLDRYMPDWKDIRKRLNEN